MKMRLRDNSLRLRLTQSEVARFHRGERLEARVQFSPTSTLRYAISTREGEFQLRACFDHACVEVLVPPALARQWSGSAEIAMCATQETFAEMPLRILVEKDFVCLKTRAHEHEDESDMFPNPNLEHGHCT